MFKNTFLEEHLRTASSEGSFYLKKDIFIPFISNFEQNEKKKIYLRLYRLAFR